MNKLLQMNIAIKLRILFCFVTLLLIQSAYSQTKYQKDFEEFWNDINNSYAYLEQQKIDWPKVKDIYQPQTASISNDADFIRLLENVLHELYNGHSSLNTNLSSSNRLIPSGLDIYAQKKGERYLVRDLRKGFGAEQSGIKIGMEITQFNGKKIGEQLKKFLPKYTNNHSPQMYQYALDMLLAGTHDTKREITVLEDGKERVYIPIDYNYGPSEQLLVAKILNEHTAYIKINNSLGNYRLIPEFDKIVDSFIKYKNIILDLTETPSGGNSTVARAMMGRFTDKQCPYQIHEFDEKEYQTKRHWVEYVSPRGKVYKGTLYVLVSHWTGSMGEGIAIGLDGMKRSKTIGTKMAGLLGAISSFQLTETKIGYQFPTERLYHVNGTPRENFVPGIKTSNMDETIQKARAIH